MPKRTDIESILIIGSGPIIIGQACEFDYSGAQACKALREDGFRVILVNSNPATIMTDPEMSDRTYIEPIRVDTVAKIIRAEKPDALLPTLGGQTGLNVTSGLVEAGVIREYGVEVLGATYEVIRKAEDRQAFKDAMIRCGVEVPISGTAKTLEEAWEVFREVGAPCVIRPAYTLGGTGGSLVEREEEFEEAARRGLRESPISEILIEEYLKHWKEFELEVMRDRADNCVIVCSIENFDPMGVHTGDSITVAPAQTLTDKEYQRMRNAAFAVIREIGVETGGSNIQFAVDPRDGRMVAIEMNPRVSRSSALASKATGFPIAKIATKLAVGYTLDEIPNDITKETPACFEPSIDYCVVKAPKFNFRKFPGSVDTLTTYMKSVGEVMSIGRTFKEALQKALAALEIRSDGFGLDGKTADGSTVSDEALRDLIRRPNEGRLFAIHRAFSQGWSVEDVAALSGIDPWFLDNLKELVEFEGSLRAYRRHDEIPQDILRRAKRLGYTDAQLARLDGRRVTERDILDVRSRRKGLGIEATFKLVDTCAAEFEAYTPYYYSTYEHEDESRASARPKVIILGGGPNRIGQGIEFDYCCVHAAFSLREEGYETIMVNSNPETVSTDYDTSDKLYFEPLTLEHVLNIWERERPEGVILQLGGQTPLNIGRGLVEAGVRILGTSYDNIDLAEDRERFRVFVERLGVRQPPSLSATTLDGALRAAEQVGYPVLVRPSFVLSGEAMRLVYDRSQLQEYWGAAIYASQDKPVLIDKFLEDATEVDVDAIADGERVVVGGIMEHIEQAGVHSGDSSCAIPSFSLSRTVLDEIRRTTRILGEALGVRGLMNIQYAVQNGVVYVLEVNPRASRTVPFVSKSIGVPLAKLAAKVMVGRKLKDLNFTEEVRIRHVSVKSPVFPFGRFPGFDPVLGPEMKSTGEVMGIADEFGTAYAKAFLGAGYRLPLEGTVFVSVMDADKKFMPPIVRDLQQLGFRILATRGTRRSLELAGLGGIEEVLKFTEGSPSVRDRIASREISLIINTPKGAGPRLDDSYIRALSIALNIPCITTAAGARAAVSGIRALRTRDYGVLPLQEYFPR